MATPASVIVGKARTILTDVDADAYRWDDPTLLGHLADGRRDLFRLRPDAFYVTGIVVELPAFTEAMGSDVGVLDAYVAPLAYYVASKALLQDAEHAANAKTAGVYMDLYSKGIA